MKLVSIGLLELSSAKLVALDILKIARRGEKIQKIDLTEELGFSEKQLDIILKRFREDELLDVLDGMIKVSPIQRVKLGIAAIHLGCDSGKVAHLLSWQDFEAFVEFALEHNGYQTRRHLILRKPRKEIDIVAVSSNLILAIDCKHWTAGGKQSILSKAVTEQLERTRRLVNEDALYRFIRGHSLPDLALPVIVTLLESSEKLITGVPTVPVHKLQNFLDEVQGYTHELRTFKTSKL